MEFEKAKQILNTEKNKKFTDDDVNEILKLLTVLAKVSINNLLKNRNNE
jgi:hypothetical protein